MGFPGDASGKEPARQCRRHKRCRFDPWAGNIPEGGHGNPLKYSFLENPMDRGAWWATVHRLTESDMTEATQHTCTVKYHLLGKKRPLSQSLDIFITPSNQGLNVWFHPTPRLKAPLNTQAQGMCIKWPSSRSDVREFQHFSAQPLSQWSKASQMILADFYPEQTQTPKRAESGRGINETPSLLCSGLCSRCLKESTCSFSTWTLWVLGISPNACGFLYLCCPVNYTYAVKKIYYS